MVVLMEVNLVGVKVDLKAAVKEGTLVERRVVLLVA